jgi:cyclophilin family peptidyl-prolyl cis-trans isomerase
LIIFIYACASSNAKAPNQPQAAKETIAIIKTTMGDMTFKFFTKDAPLSCANFIKLAKAGFYNNREFYRVVKGHVIQAGVGEGEGVDYTVKAEFNKNPNITGAVGMARAEDPDSASTEFYICPAPLRSAGR